MFPLCATVPVSPISENDSSMPGRPRRPTPPGCAALSRRGGHRQAGRRSTRDRWSPRPGPCRPCDSATRGPYDDPLPLPCGEVGVGAPDTVAEVDGGMPSELCGGQRRVEGTVLPLAAALGSVPRGERLA